MTNQQPADDNRPACPSTAQTDMSTPQSFDRGAFSAELRSDDVAASIDSNSTEQRLLDELPELAPAPALASAPADSSDSYQPWWCDVPVRARTTQCGASRRFVLVASTLLHWCGAGFVGKGALVDLAALYRRQADDGAAYVFYLALAVCLLLSAVQVVAFYRGSVQLIAQLKRFEPQLLWWHFMPPGNITVLIVCAITTIALVKKFAIDAAQRPPLWPSFVILPLDASIACALAVGGAVVCAECARHCRGVDSDRPAPLADREMREEAGGR